jgi:hypothetical protein
VAAEYLDQLIGWQGAHKITIGWPAASIDGSEHGIEDGFLDTAGCCFVNGVE